MTPVIKNSLLFLGVMTLSSGCASNSELRRVENEAKEARRVADQALNTANEARQTAQDVDGRSKRTEEIVNRSFRKSMYK